MSQLDVGETSKVFQTLDDPTPMKVGLALIDLIHDLTSLESVYKFYKRKLIKIFHIRIENKH